MCLLWYNIQRNISQIVQAYRCKLFTRCKYDFNVDIQNSLQLYICYGS